MGSWRGPSRRDFRKKIWRSRAGLAVCRPLAIYPVMPGLTWINILFHFLWFSLRSPRLGKTEQKRGPMSAPAAHFSLLFGSRSGCLPLNSRAFSLMLMEPSLFSNAVPILIQRSFFRPFPFASTICVQLVKSSPLCSGRCPLFGLGLDFVQEIFGCVITLKWG